MRRLGRHWLLLLLIACAATGVWRLSFDVEILNLLPRSQPEVQGLAIYNNHFDNARELVLSVHGSASADVEEAAVAIAARLRRDTRRVAEAHWQPPWREHPDQTAALLAHAWINQPPESFAALTNRLQPEVLGRELATARQRLATTFSPSEFAMAGYDPVGFTRIPGEADSSGPQFGRGDEMFASADGTFRLVFVQATSDLADYRECAMWLEGIKSDVQEIAESTTLLDAVTVRYTGRPAFVSEISGGMQSDMTRSVIGTALIVAVLFWWAHRRFKPMGWLMLLMATAIGLTLVFGGLLYGPLNVVSVGFAAILLGLAADYGMVLYQEWRESPGPAAAATTGSARRGVRWSALTTASAFLMLNFSGLPGLAQLGTLVAIGVMVGAALMLRLYLKPFQRESTGRATPDIPRERTREPAAEKFNQRMERVAWTVTAAAVIGMILSLWSGLPGLNRSADALRPSSSPAYRALDEIQSHMQRDQPSLWLILSGKDEADLGTRLDEAEVALRVEQEEGRVSSFTLPTRLWPRPENRAANRTAAQAVVDHWPGVRSLVLSNGFTTNALLLGDGAVREFARMVTSTNLWPDNDVANWSLGQFTARTKTNLFAVGLVYPGTNGTGTIHELPGQAEGHAWLVGWQRLGSALADLVQRDLTRVLIPTLLVIVLCLSLAFRRVVEVLLSLVALLFSLLALCALMKAAGWSWNLLNMMAMPLLLGVGVDYSIHTQLALQRQGGDLRRMRRSVGRALLLCAATTATGFGSLALSNNAGLASLGKVCASGVVLSYITATVLLPCWWRVLRRNEVGNGHTAATATHTARSDPSSLYSVRLWRMGLWLGRRLPYPVLVQIGTVCALLYRVVARHRFDTVLANLRPLCPSEAAAEAAAHRLFTHFSRKLVDLWVYESGGNIDHKFGELQGLEHILSTQASGKGLLLVTPHLGNWEFGAPLLTRQGVSMQVVTLAEPDEQLTELRKQSRALRDVETLVIGADPFGFIELIRKLEDGATVALLVDRPAQATAVTVELFNRPIHASFAPAELARATGCAILPVHILREGNHYVAEALAPVDYDRAALRDPVARHQLTQKIMRAFEPAIRQHPDQWYHFVPIWPAPAAPPDPAADI